MRGPVLGTDAVVLSVPLSAVFDGQQASAKLHRLRLGKDTIGDWRGVRDLTRYGNRFLELAGPVNDPPEDRKSSQAIIPCTCGMATADWNAFKDIPAFGKKVKPEALVLLKGDARRARVLVLFDGTKKGAPQALDVKLK